jgi:hypothetical protein
MNKVWYVLNTGQTISINDISKHIVISSKWKNDPRVQLQYTIKDAELPHQLAYRMYGSVDLYWVILLANDISDLNHQWPLTPIQVDSYITTKYPNNNPSDVHHYISPNGLIADLLSIYVLYGATTDAQAISIGNLSSVSIYDYEHALNDLKRNIIIIDPDSVRSVVNEYETLMGQL